MDFAAILANWEKKNRHYPDKDSLKSAQREDDKVMSVASPYNGNAADNDNRKKPGAAGLRKMRPQAVIDLHGMKAPEAEKALWKFMASCREKGLVKVLIIHGKGLHSDGEGVLKKVVDDFLRDCPHAGMNGTPDSRDGGSGARWVIIK